MMPALGGVSRRVRPPPAPRIWSRLGPVWSYRVGRVDDHLAGELLAVLGDELPEGVEPDGEHEHVGPLDRFVDAHHSRVTAEAGGELPGGLLVAAGQEEVLTTGREV